MLRWMILPISSLDDSRGSFLLSRFCGSVFLVSGFLLSAFFGSGFLLSDFLALRLLSLALGFSLLVLPWGSDLVLDLSFEVSLLLDFALLDDLAGADLLVVALGVGLAFGAAWAMLPYANSRASAVERRRG